MKRHAFLLPLFCIVLLVVTGCGSTKATSSSSISGTLVSNPFASTINASNVSGNSSAGSVETYAAFGYGIDAVKSYTYSGNPITCNYYLEYSGPKEKEEFGNILFLDGIVQPFSVDGNGENIYFYKYTVNMNEKNHRFFHYTRGWKKRRQQVGYDRDILESLLSVHGRQPSVYNEKSKFPHQK